MIATMVRTKKPDEAPVLMSQDPAWCFVPV
jgi:hypothetical protein